MLLSFSRMTLFYEGLYRYGQICQAAFFAGKGSWMTFVTLRLSNVFTPKQGCGAQLVLTILWAWNQDAHC